jgi:hypothetical protein
MDSKNILYAFIAICVLYFFSSLFQFNSLELFSKPLFLPLLFLYYVKKLNDNYQYRVVIIFIFFYIAEMLVMFDIKEYYIISVSFFLIPYMILLYFVTKNLIFLLKNNGYNKINFILFFIFAFLVYFAISIFLIIDTESIYEQFLLYLYGFVLLLLAVFSITSYFLKNSIVNLFLILTVIAFIISDLFYLFIVKIEYNCTFKSVNLISQLLSYYFFITYSLIQFKEK